MLLQVRDYIKQQGQVSSQQLCRHFSIDYSAIEPILQRWQQAGVIEAHQATSACAKKCQQCSPDPIIFYQLCR